MKNILLVFAILLFNFAFGQKKPVDLVNTKLINNELFNFFSNGTQVSGGSVVFPPVLPGGGITLDSNRNLITGLNPSIVSSVGNTVLVDNVYLTNSHNNLVAAKNLVINGASGTISSGADHTIYTGAHYSAAFNDANQVGGESSLTGGFGNYNFNSNSFVFGNNNVAGNLSKSLVQANLYTGGALIGTNLRSQGTNITMIGYSFNSTVTGFHVGFGRAMFSVTTDGKVWINGVAYTFPTSQGAAGSVLTNDGFGNLSWQVPAGAVASRSFPKTYPVVGLNGAINGYVQIQQQ